MKFAANIADLLEAVSLVGIVTPAKDSGYLFKVVGERCYVYSSDSLCVARAEFSVSSDADGEFIYPVANIDALRFLGKHTVRFETVEEEGKFIVRYQVSNGAKSERTTRNPKSLSTCDQELQKAEEAYTVPAKVLQKALVLSKPFMGKDAPQEKFRSIRLHTDLGDGYLCASDGQKASFFWSEAFQGKAFSVHQLHLDNLIGFLAKSPGEIQVLFGAQFTFARNTKGQVFGWPKYANADGIFSTYALDIDYFVLGVDRQQLYGTLQYLKKELDSNYEKVRIVYSHEQCNLEFVIADGSSKIKSPPTAVRLKSKPDGEVWALPESWSFDISLDHLMSLVKDNLSPEVELRVWWCQVAEARKPTGVFRTIDEFRLDSNGESVPDSEGSVLCRVIRFMSSRM